MGHSKLRQEKLQPCSLPYPPCLLLVNWNWGAVSVSSRARHSTDQTSQQIPLRKRLWSGRLFCSRDTARQARWVEGKALCYKTKRSGQKHCTASSGVSDATEPVATSTWLSMGKAGWWHDRASASSVTDSGVAGSPGGTLLMLLIVNIRLHTEEVASAMALT